MSASISGAQMASTTTLPGEVMSCSALVGGLIWGRSISTTAMKPASARKMTSRKTVVELSPSSGSSGSMGFSVLGDRGCQLDRAPGKQAEVDRQPDVQDRADQSRVERGRHAGDQRGDHRTDGADIGDAAR